MYTFDGKEYNFLIYRFTVLLFCIVYDKVFNLGLKNEMGNMVNNTDPDQLGKDFVR